MDIKSDSNNGISLISLVAANHVLHASLYTLTSFFFLHTLAIACYCGSAMIRFFVALLASLAGPPSVVLRLQVTVQLAKPASTNGQLQQLCECFFEVAESRSKTKLIFLKKII